MKISASELMDLVVIANARGENTARMTLSAQLEHADTTQRGLIKEIESLKADRENAIAAARQVASFPALHAERQRIADALRELVDGKTLSPPMFAVIMTAIKLEDFK